MKRGPMLSKTHMRRLALHPHRGRLLLFLGTGTYSLGVSAKWTLVEMNEPAEKKKTMPFRIHIMLMMSQDTDKAKQTLSEHKHCKIFDGTIGSWSCQEDKHVAPASTPRRVPSHIMHTPLDGEQESGGCRTFDGLSPEALRTAFPISVNATHTSWKLSGVALRISAMSLGPPPIFRRQAWLFGSHAWIPSLKSIPENLGSNMRTNLTRL